MGTTAWDEKYIDLSCPGCQLGHTGRRCDVGRVRCTKCGEELRIASTRLEVKRGMASNSDISGFEFLAKKNSLKSSVHLWNGSDTVCRQWSGGGIGNKYRIYKDVDPNRKICSVCWRRKNKRQRPVAGNRKPPLRDGDVVAPVAKQAAKSDGITVPEIEKWLNEKISSNKVIFDMRPSEPQLSRINAFREVLRLIVQGT